MKLNRETAWCQTDVLKPVVMQCHKIMPYLTPYKLMSLSANTQHALPFDRDSDKKKGVGGVCGGEGGGLNNRKPHRSTLVPKSGYFLLQ